MKASFNARHNTAKLSANGGLKGLDIPTALAAVESEPVITGTASLTWTLKSSGRTANELIEAMNGPLKLTTDQVVLKEMGIEKMFCQVVALANQQGLTAEFPADSAVKDLSADIQLNDGKVKLNPLKVDLEGISLRGKGRLELLSQDFKADFDARITPALGELDPACRVNERYTSIDWPVDCEGNVSGEPGDWCMVDSGEILEQLAKKEATRKVQKEAGKLLDKLFK
jgi:AsmA protein